MKPNILFIMTDQQRFDSLGCYGCEAIQTPNIDSIGEEGIIFEQCYVNNPVCTPSRASIFTGKTLPGHGVYQLNDILPENEIMFPEYLKQAGYETALFGKLHVSSAVFEKDNRNPHDGFDRYCWNHEPVLFENSPYNEYAQWMREADKNFYEEFFRKRRNFGPVPGNMHCTAYLCDTAAEYIRERSLEKPFFCCLSFFDPHNPYTDCPVEGLEAVDMMKLREPEVYPGDKCLPKDIIREREHGYMKDIKGYTEKTLRDMRHGYLGSIAFLDQQLKKVFDALKEKGIMEDTMIIFVSDHGDMLGDHGLLAKGAFFFDGCTRVPLLIKPVKNRQGGRHIHSLVQPSDLAATILSAAGYDKNWLESIMPESKDLLDMKKTDDRAVFCLYRGSGICDTMNEFNPPINATMIRRGRYKMNIYHQPGQDRCEGELYDMEKDPRETVNLWKWEEYADTCRKLLEIYLNWQVECGVRYIGGRGGHTQSVTQVMK